MKIASVSKMPSRFLPRMLIVLFHILLAMPVVLMAQNFTNLKGLVTDNLNKAVSNATISLFTKENLNVETTTSNASGQFSIRVVYASDIYLLISRIGFVPLKVSADEIKLRQRSNQYSFTLIESPKELQQVTVTATKELIQRKSGKTVLNVEADIMATGSSVLELLQKAPDVQLDDNGNLTLKGKSTVQVMIDGKNSYLSADQVTKMLKSMPGSAISSIEIITQPGAQYEAAGNAGIINIKTKSKHKQGFNADFTIATGLGTSLRQNDNFNLNFNKGKFNLYSLYSFSNVPTITYLSIQRLVKNNNRYTFFDQNTSFHERIVENFFKVGAEYSLVANQKLSFSVSRDISHWPGYQNTNTKYENLQHEIDTVLKTHANYPAVYLNTLYSLDYRNLIDTNGRELRLSADVSRYRNQDYNHVESSFFSPSDVRLGQESVFENFLPSSIDIMAFKADYAAPLSNHSKWSTGLKYSNVDSKNSTLVDTLGSKGYSTDFSQGNSFRYKESIVAAYTSINTVIKHTQIQLGIRLEKTISNGISSYQNSNSKRAYLDFFPQLSLSQKLGDKHQVEASYSRRIDRPSYGDLNPFKFYVDKNTFGIGNPFLRPQYTDAIELTDTYKENVISSISFGWTQDFQIPVARTDSVSRISNRIPQNINHLFSLSYSISMPFSPLNGWTILTSASANYNNFRADSSVAGIAVARNMVGVNLNLTNTVDLPWKIKMVLTGYFHSPFFFGFTVTKPQYLFNAGFRKTILSGNGDIKLAVNDLFNINQIAGHQVYGSTNRNFIKKNETRFATLSFSYRLGKSAKSIKHESSASDEQSRVSTPGK